MYMKKLLDSDWIKDEYSFSCNMNAKLCNTGANYNVILIGLRTIEIIQHFGKKLEIKRGKTITGVFSKQRLCLQMKQQLNKFI